jgi:hypothetical protein
VFAYTQTLIGAWESISLDANGDKLRSVVLFAEEFQVMSIYNVTNGKFIHASGGSWKLAGDIIKERIEFNTDNPSLIGTEINVQVAFTKDSFKLIANNKSFKRINHASDGLLSGAWLMSGRVKDGISQMRDTSGPRKTMKILSGSRFQWIAYNVATKEFLGTGGGTYSAKDGAYIEKIDFFSRDDSKVGVALKFEYKIIDGNWHHSGLSSKGDALHEIWSRRH